MLLARNFSSNKSINNVVESSFQSLLDLGGTGRCCLRQNWQGKWRAWTHHRLGQETWLLRRFHGEKDTQKKWSKEKNWETQCLYCVQWERQKKMWFKKEKFEKHNACIVCSEKMAMECRQVSTLEHEGERWTCIVCSEKMSMECRQVSTLEHEGE